MASSTVAQDTSFDLSRSQGVIAYLARTPFASTSVEHLSGGNANFSFRLHLQKPYQGRNTVVLKHAKPYVATANAIPFSVERQTLEAEALRHVARLIQENSPIKVPQIHLHDPRVCALIMDDCGASAQNLKDIFIKDATLAVSDRALPLERAEQLGGDLGTFLALVHNEASEDAELLRLCAGNEQSKTISAFVTYGRIIETLKGEGQGFGLIDGPLDISENDYATLAELASETSQAILTASTNFANGDFWTGNIVLDERALRKGADTPAFVIDWEAVRPGLQYLDVGQFAAEMRSLGIFFRESRESVEACLSSFFREYARHRPVDEEFARGVAVHIGAHLVTWTPRVHTWTPKTKVTETVKEGLEYLLKGWRNDVGWLKTSVVSPLFAQ